MNEFSEDKYLEILGARNVLVETLGGKGLPEPEDGEGA